jgi:protein-disulfide isomerase
VNKQFIGVLIVVVTAVFGAFWFSQNKSTTTTNGTVQATNHTQGAGSKGVTLIEYGDFQCPACGFHYPMLKQVKAKYGDQIKFQFRHFPLQQLHPNAMAAHRAAEAAHLQGKFWEMHDILYERQNSWTRSTTASKVFESYAEELGLDLVKFRQDAASELVSGTINADIKEGQAIKATSTPTLVLNGKKQAENPNDVEAYFKLIDEAIAEQAATSGTGE